MREIKFRAWDREEKRYLRPLDTASMVLRFLSGRVTDGGLNCPHIELQQYTGVKDKNDVEIYEGDIMCDYDNEIIGIVEFVKGAFYVHSLHEKEFYDLWDFSCEEVIGNIYENPELGGELCII